ncbi:ferritin-like domain-containing protein [Actinomycetospora sp. NBC_00405]|uniref:ferritin-like domain-containing protein n=1 Tax=Actinomycetospora sp. NBC_00405 TaxID=2975952 RepID=UPI002E209415
MLDLVRVSPADQDLDWLKTALQAAVELELATIPPYLCAMWSVKENADPVRSMIRDIAIEEMAHMATACNLPTAIGGTPAINTIDAVPKYPGPLPGEVHPGLVVPLAGLSRDLIWNVFMEIELPFSGPVLFAEGMAFPTIGAFYETIARAYEQLPPDAITGERQIEVGAGTGAAFTIADRLDAKQAISRIKEQGEGSSNSPLGDPDTNPLTDDLAHYYQVAEIFYGRRLVAVDGLFEFVGDVIPFPDVLPMAEVPPAGYPESADFDQAYKSILDKLQSAWENGDQSAMNISVSDMFALESEAVALMETPLPGGGGTFGPDFKLPS